MSIPGVDVASYQGAIDWAAVAATGIQFGLTKATEGTTYVNPTFMDNWAGMKANGIARGCFHFARPDRGTDPIAEARWFLKALYAAGGPEPGDVVALDIETAASPTQDVSDWALTWLQTVEETLGCRPLLYSGDWFMAPHGLEGVAALGEYGLWYAAYQGAEPDPPAPWGFTAIWQYSDSGVVAGISGKVDLDVFNGDVAAFKRYGVPQPAQKPPFGEHERLQLCGYLASGSGVADVIAWVSQYSEAT